MRSGRDLKFKSVMPLLGSGHNFFVKGSVKRLAAAIAIAIQSTTACTAEPPVCGELRQVLRSSERTSRLEIRLTAFPADDGDLFENLDVDGYDINDRLVRSCPGDIGVPADPCQLSLKLSTGLDTIFRFEFGEDFDVVRHNGAAYAIAMNASKGAERRESVIQITKSGFKPICTESN